MGARRRKFLIRRAGALTLGLAAFSSAVVSANGLTNGVSAQVRRARWAAHEVGVHIVDVADGRTVFEHRADRQLVVASNTKLVTTAAALDALGPGYLFETPVLIRGELIRGRLYGDLAVVGSGDPNISGRHYAGEPLAPLEEWAGQLAALGIRQVHGAVYLVHGLFDGERIHSDWPRDQINKWYEAPVSAISFSDNCVLVRVAPGAQPGSRAMVQVIPDLDLVEVENLAVTTSSRRSHLVVVDRAPESNTIQVSGRVLRRTLPVETWVTVADPVEYFGYALARAFEVREIRVGGGFQAVQDLPAGQWRVALRHRSDLLSTLEVINRNSQNFFAESLLKVLGARMCGDGSWAGGLKVLSSFLGRAGIDDGYQLADGSGMSRNNRFSARQLTTLLTYMSSHEWGPEFIQSLPFSGLEEHHRWRSRLADEPYRGNVFAKTGFLRGVSTISGYARARSGRTYAFSILLNRVENVGAARRAQDRILKALIDRG